LTHCKISSPIIKSKIAIGKKPIATGLRHKGIIAEKAEAAYQSKKNHSLTHNDKPPNRCRSAPIRRFTPFFDNSGNHDTHDLKELGWIVMPVKNLYSCMGNARKNHC